MSYAIELFDRFYLFSGVFRWLHILVGIVWIGILYYFNLVQVPAFAAFGDNAAARNLALDQVARRALWWFRWAALSTFVFGLLITGQEDYWSNDFFKRATGLSILIGMILGTIMFLNVWGVIWRKQKVVLANAHGVLNGQAADPGAAPRAGSPSWPPARTSSSRCPCCGSWSGRRTSTRATASVWI